MTIIQRIVPFREICRPHMGLKDLCFNREQDRDPHCNFPQLHPDIRHGKAGKGKVEGRGRDRGSLTGCGGRPEA
jgi:hypothetical protein